MVFSHGRLLWKAPYGLFKPVYMIKTKVAFWRAS